MNLNLAPRSLDEYISNESIRKIIAISISACKDRGLSLGNVLLTGQRGTGKTTLASLIAKELRLEYRIISATAIRKMSDLNALFLSNLPPILIIDEIHNLEPAFTDAFHEVIDSASYTYIEDGMLNTVNVGPINFIGTTTDEGRLTSPMLSRFGKKYHLQLYSPMNLQKILMNIAKNNNIVIDSSGAYEIAIRSGKVPRNAVLHFVNVYEFALKYNNGRINRKIVLDCLLLHGIDLAGLNDVQRDILRILSRTQKPIGQESLSQISGVGSEALVRLYEPPLLAAGFIRRSSTGREITPQGRAHLKLANVVVKK
jgi:Holliday junction DNA helicase RuvB